MTLSVKDPVYQSTLWQAPAIEPAQLEQQLTDLHQRIDAWQQQDEAQRQAHIVACHQAIRQADHLPAKLSTYCGMTQQQTQAWLQAITTADLATPPPSGVVVILNNSLEPTVWSTLWACLQVGSAVLLANTVPMAAVAAELMAQCPAGLPISVAALAELAQPTWQQADIAGLYCFSDALTASTVHESLAGRFNLPAHFHTPLCHQVLLPPQADIEAALEKIVPQALACSGQYFGALRQIIVFKSHYAALLKQLTTRLKALRVAAYDAKPQPDLSSLCSTTQADQVYQDFLALRKLTDIKIHIPMRKLLNSTGMLTPGLIEVPLHRLAQAPAWCAPLLQLIVIDDLTQIAQVRRNTNAPGDLYTCDANQGMLNKLKLVLRHTVVKTLALPA